MLAGLALAALVADGDSLAAQVMGDRPTDGPRTEAPRTEEVSYWNPADSTLLSASLVLPRQPGPHPGVVLLSVADTRGVVDELVREGHAVLLPVRRGFVDVDPLLEATFEDLARDVDAAVEHLGSRPDVDGEAITLVAQAHDTPPAMLWSATSEVAIPLVLLAAPIRPGAEEFQTSQLRLARRAGWPAEELDALDRYVQRIPEIVVSDELPYAKAYRLAQLQERSGVPLPRNAELPSDGRQAAFLASPLWSDRMRFDPEAVLSRLRSPVLVLVGEEEANTDAIQYVEAVRHAVSDAPTESATVCLLPGRTRHTFTDEGIGAITEWLRSRARVLPFTCPDHRAR